MSAIATLLNVFLIASSLFSYIILSIYFQQYVVVAIISITALQFVILKLLFFGKSSQQYIVEFFYDNQKEFGARESRFIFFIAILTAWVSPSTVWISGSSFLLVSNIVNAVLQGLAIIGIILLSRFTSIFLNSHSTNILHCFKDVAEFSEQKYRHLSDINMEIIRLIL